LVQGNQFECKKPWFENKTLVQEEYETLLSYRETNIHKKPWYREFTEQKNFSTWKLLNTRNLSNNKLFECGKSWYRETTEDQKHWNLLYKYTIKNKELRYRKAI
jgi:hypothetical protein